MNGVGLWCLILGPFCCLTLVCTGSAWRAATADRANVAAYRLMDDLLQNYFKLVRPVANHSLPVSILFGMTLTKIMNVHEKSQTISFSGNLFHFWYDYKLAWNPAEYDWIEEVKIPAEMLWMPDIVLYDTADGSPHVLKQTKAKVQFTGTVTWEPPVLYKAVCKMNIEWFPFDEQECSLKFGPWSHVGTQIDMNFVLNDQAVEVPDPNPTSPGQTRMFLERAVVLTEYQESGEWDLLRAYGARHFKPYPCCGDIPYVDITFYLHIRRKPLFYVLNLIVPCVCVISLCAGVFLLPSNSNSKINLAVSILVSLTVFLLLLVDIIPPTSLVIPLIAKYIVFSLIITTLSICATVFVLNIHYRSTMVQQMPNWQRRIFLGILPKILFFTTRRNVEAQQSVETLRRLSRMVARDPRQLAAAGAFRKSNKATRSNDPAEHLKLRISVNVMYIANHLKSLKDDQILREDWKFVATVVDRCFMIIFTSAIALGTMYFLVRIPMLYDTRVPVTLQSFNGTY